MKHIRQTASRNNRGEVLYAILIDGVVVVTGATLNEAWTMCGGCLPVQVEEK